MSQVAVLVDGEFFIRRVRAMFSNMPNVTPEFVTQKLRHSAKWHSNHLNLDTYRIFFYDCAPFDKKYFNPISRQTIDLKKTDLYKFRSELHQQLRQQRKVALRLGELRDDMKNRWIIKPEVCTELFAGRKKFDEIAADDIKLNLRQKEVDMKIGVDIASLTLKKQVSAIVLISGDGDFVPAAKLARREGIDFILDPMRVPVSPGLFEHIDGLHCAFKTNRNSVVKRLPIAPEAGTAK